LKILKLPKEKLDLFASVVQQFGELHAPVQQDGKYAFKPLTRWSEARLEYDRTILPPKKYFLSPREALFCYSPGAGFEPCTEGLDQRDPHLVGSRNSSWLPSNAKRLVEAASLAFPYRSNFLTIRERNRKDAAPPAFPIWELSNETSLLTRGFELVCRYNSHQTRLSRSTS
jgi:hypothetical protein